MNYRHAFHAGNFADVVKHAVLTLIVRHLCKKDTPFALIDSHAGIGRYDLWTEAPNKTDEYKDGIGRLWGLAQDRSTPSHPGDPVLNVNPSLKQIDRADSRSQSKPFNGLDFERPALGAPPPELVPYLSLVAAMNGEFLRHYPGSPWLMRQLMRPQDRLILAEKHPDDAQSLKTLFHGDKQVAVHAMDGWQALKAFLPPPEKRGLLLIDPPFEEPGEYQRLGEALIRAQRRWPQGVLLAWHPIKDLAPVEALHESLRQSGIPGILSLRHLVKPAGDPKILAGSGLILVNPPYQLDQDLQAMLPFLAEILAQGEGATAGLDWIAKDV